MATNKHAIIRYQTLDKLWSIYFAVELIETFIDAILLWFKKNKYEENK